MKLFVFALCVVACAAAPAKLDNTYLPPGSARTAGGNSNFLATPRHGDTPNQAYGAPNGAQGKHGGNPSQEYGAPNGHFQSGAQGRHGGSSGGSPSQEYGAPNGQFQPGAQGRHRGSSGESPSQEYGAPKGHFQSGAQGRHGSSNGGSPSQEYGASNGHFQSGVQGRHGGSSGKSPNQEYGAPNGHFQSGAQGRHGSSHSKSPSQEYGAPNSHFQSSSQGQQGASHGGSPSQAYGAPGAQGRRGGQDFSHEENHGGNYHDNYRGNYQNGARGGPAPRNPENDVPILRFDNENNGDGSYHYAYETGNGIQAEETGQLKNLGQEEVNQVQGSYSYTGDDGQQYTVTYIADENGFQPQGDHIPTAPPVPEAILKSLQYNAAEEAQNTHRGGDNGGYYDDGHNGQEHRQNGYNANSNSNAGYHY